MSTPNAAATFAYFENIGLPLRYNAGSDRPWALMMPGACGLLMTFPSLERLWKSVKRMIGEQFKDVAWADRVILELENNNRGGSAQIRSWFEDEDSRSPKVMHDLRYEMEDKDYLPTHWKTRYAELTHRVGGAINPIFGSILRQHLKEKSNPSR